MKKFIWIPILCLLLLFGCTQQVSNESTETTQPVLANTNTSPTEKTPGVIECAVTEGLVTRESLQRNTPCQIRLTKQPKNEEAGYALVIEVATGSAVLKKELDSGVIPRSHESMLYLGDVDGDEIKEILIHHNTGGVGGFGLWQTWVLKIKGNEIHTLFENFNEFDTGFESRFLDGYQLEVKNRFTDYSFVFGVKDSHKAYIANSQEMPAGNICLDPFYVFEPKDVDDDGICEIVCAQYSSIIGHADYTGTAHSVLKFNTATQLFEVVYAWYEPNTEG